MRIWFPGIDESYMNVIGSPFLFIIYEGKGAVAFRTMLRVHNLLWVDASAPSLLDSSRQLRSGAHGRKFGVSFADSGPNNFVSPPHEPVDVHFPYGLE